jgi:hypothetical protein
MPEPLDPQDALAAGRFLERNHRTAVPSDWLLGLLSLAEEIEAGGSWSYVRDRDCDRLIAKINELRKARP